jgi:hypothetical protein
MTTAANGPAWAEEGFCVPSADLLIGASAIAAYLYRDPSRTATIYRLKAKGVLPLFRLGRDLAAKRSELERALTTAGAKAHAP